MGLRWSSGSGEALRRAAVGVLAAVLATAGVGPTLAQQPPAPAAPRPATPARPPAAAQKPPAQPAQPAPPAQTAPPPAAAAPGATAEPPKLIYSQWTKFCDKGQDPSGKQVCATGREARTEAGQPVVAAVLIEPEGVPQKLFRITLPAPVMLQYGTRIVIDQEPALSAPFFTCLGAGCVANYEGTPDLVGKLKKGKTLFVQAVAMNGAAVSFPLPLADNSGSFQKSNEGPPIDPKVLADQQKKLEEEMRKRQEQNGPK
jgi:invasion protein IalB